MAVVLPVGVVATATSAAAAVDLARGGTASASAFQDDIDGTFRPEHAIDGDVSTRWASGNGPDADEPFTAWWQVDLGGAAGLERLTLEWEESYATRYQVQVASVAPGDSASWTTVHTQDAGDGGTDHVTFEETRTARYVRVQMTERAPVHWDPAGPHWYGYSLVSAEVWGVPGTGPARTLDTFEDGVPAGYAAWGSAGDVTPTLRTVPADRPGVGAGNDVLQADVPAAGPGAWYGFSKDASPAVDWSDADGFSFWFRGRGAGGVLRFELKSDGQAFEHRVVDDSEGWRRVTAMFSNLRLKSDPGSAARFDASSVSGFAVTLTDLGPGTWHIDDVALVERSTTLQDFDGDVPLAQPYGPGLFTFASPGAEVGVEVSQRPREGAPSGNRVLSGTYRVPAGGWGGVSHNLATAQDWSAYRGLRFWWYASQDTRPASPTAGADVEVEIKDGGPDAERAERWVATFKDSWSAGGGRWKLVEIPFTQFAPSDHQPVDDATRNGSLDLTSAWGYALTMPVGTANAVPYAVDDVQLYGSPVAAAEVAVGPTQGVYLVDPGATAQIPVRVTTAAGQPLPQDVQVAYRTDDGTATGGSEYTPTSGTLTFGAGTPSGAEQVIAVPTNPATTGDARTFTVELTPSGGADLSTTPRVVVNATGAPYLDPALPTEARVEDLLGRMTLREKVGQMTQAERLGLDSPEQVATLGLGSLLSGGGSVPEGNTAEAWADMVDGFQREALSTRLQIPLVYGVDAVHGHSNVLDATITPHNSGLGASRDPALVRRAAEVTAVEVRGTGVQWTFAPCLCVTRDDRWGRSYEAFGEDPALVTALARSAVVGLQGDTPADLSGTDHVLATAKHWVGDGGTRYEPSRAGTGYPIDQGVTHVGSLAELRAQHIAPYAPAVDAGVGSIMPSYSAVAVGGGEPLRMHEHRQLNTDVLKGELGFDGFLISDWEAIGLLPGADYADKAARAVNAGLDMAMEPYRYEEFISAITAKVGDGTVSPSRVDDAVRRILTQKFALGLFERPLADRTRTAEMGSAEHRAVAREAAAASQVLLKNDGVLPLAGDARVYVAGSNADDLGHQMGGWSISWQGGSGDTTTGASILEGIREVAPGAQVTWSRDATAPMAGADVGVVVVGEPPYAEGIGDVGNNGRSLELTGADKAAIDRVCSAMPCAVLVVAGRAQLVTDRIGQIDALVASWLPGSEGAGVADVLFGRRPFTGRLPITWPASAAQVPINVGDATYAPLYAYGWGLRTDAQRPRLEAVRDALPAGSARDAVSAVLDADVWSGQSVGTDRARVDRAVRLLTAAARQLDGTGEDRFVQAGAVVSVLRDLAQGSVVAGQAPGGAARTTADAEHALMSGRAGEAATLLAGVVGVTV